jgi:hypothetical protein
MNREHHSAAKPDNQFWPLKCFVLSSHAMGPWGSLALRVPLSAGFEEGNDLKVFDTRRRSFDFVVTHRQ